MQNQNKYTIIARLKKEKRLKTKRALIMIRLTVNGQRSEISIKKNRSRAPGFSREPREGE